MGEFSINTNQINSAATRFELLSQKVGDVQRIVDNVNTGLASIGIARVAPALFAITNKTNICKKDCIMLSETLKKIVNTYINTEESITATAHTSHESTAEHSTNAPFVHTKLTNASRSSNGNADDEYSLINNGEVNWSEVEEILQKDIEDITEAEWEALANLGLHIDAEDMNRLFGAFLVEDYQFGLRGYSFDAEKYNMFNECCKLEFNTEYNDYLETGNSEEEIFKCMQRLALYSSIPPETLNTNTYRELFYFYGGDEDYYYDNYDAMSRPYINIQPDGEDLIVSYSPSYAPVDSLSLNSIVSYTVGAPVIDEAEVRLFINERIKDGLSLIEVPTAESYIFDLVVDKTVGVMCNNPVTSAFFFSLDCLSDYADAKALSAAKQNISDLSDCMVLYSDLVMGIIPITYPNGSTKLLPYSTYETNQILNDCMASDILSDPKYNLNWNLTNIQNDPLGFYDALHVARQDDAFEQEYIQIIDKYD